MQKIDAKAYLPTFIRLISDIALALPGATVTRFPNKEDNWLANINTPQIALYLKLDSIAGKLDISVDWPSWKSPRCDKNVVTYQDIASMLTQDERNAVVTSIKSSVDKGAAKIARDIQTRLIPYAELAYRRAVERCQTNEKTWNAQHTTLVELSQYFNIPMGYQSDRLLTNGVEIQVNTATSVRIHNISCSPEMAKKIIALLRSEKK